MGLFGKDKIVDPFGTMGGSGTPPSKKEKERKASQYLLWRYRLSSPSRGSRNHPAERPSQQPSQQLGACTQLQGSRPPVVQRLRVVVGRLLGAHVVDGGVCRAAGQWTRPIEPNSQQSKTADSDFDFDPGARLDPPGRALRPREGGGAGERPCSRTTESRPLARGHMGAPAAEPAPAAAAATAVASHPSFRRIAG